MALMAKDTKRVEHIACVGLLLVFLFASAALSGKTFSAEQVQSQYPVDFTFLVADLKYSQERGVKICEIQQGILSTFYGDRFVHGEPGVIPVKFNALVANYFASAWTRSNYFSEAQIRQLLKNSSLWEVKSSMSGIFKSSGFKRAAAAQLHDQYDIACYRGLLAARPEDIKGYAAFNAKYPGIVVMDASNHDYWVDKYKMSKLFTMNEVLEAYKPQWKSYIKKYNADLTRQIKADFNGDIFVIKPRGAFMGNGVIIVHRDELDAVLFYILNKSPALLEDPDKSFKHWYHDRGDSFIVEEFIPSDPIAVAHFGNKMYQPTMRVAFILAYSNREITLEYLGGYWITPLSALSEPGSLNQKHKAFGKPPYFCGVSPEVLDEVEKQLDIALPLLYGLMLENK